MKESGSSSLVYIDETGFDTNPTCIYGWSKRGQRLFGDQQGKRRKRESLVAARRTHMKDFIARMIFNGFLDAVGFAG
ncbi:transposase [Synechococcus sp. PCC 6312]|uniref:transposase n=1 Tax=Synechococcus sp. (strain ATCC 27167 / PCC 6312) TaxID=195253 RepID=UPI0002E96CE6|nr:transposase [Synechococcus sp. PCC 6312]